MATTWCATCLSQHTIDERCPGELNASGPERHAWRVNVETPRGMEAYGVLIAPSDDLFRARVLTFPNILWLAPGMRGTMKFTGRSADEAGQKAIAFVRDHCRERRFTLRREMVEIVPTGDGGAAFTNKQAPAAPRKTRFLPVRFGVAGPTELAGTGDLSETGMFIITDTPVQSGNVVNLSLVLDHDRIPLRGSVIWKRKEHRSGRSPGMGVRLESPPSSYLRYVRELE